jgi:hypothetical protein
MMKLRSANPLLERSWHLMAGSAKLPFGELWPFAIVFGCGAMLAWWAW